ncbi:MAG: hypothetical protein GC186_08945 [Rhodobacteraceae bacterium]|nr:hypothetical protein [Paracoccaceae bacterium]
MSHKPLDPSDRELLAVLVGLHAERGPITREVLSVEARGRGIEVARPLLNLKFEGLVEETVFRPGLLKRLLGAKSIVLLRPTDAGLAVGQVAAPDAADSAEAPTTGFAPVDDTPMEQRPAAAPAALPKFLRVRDDRLATATTASDAGSASRDQALAAPASPTRTSVSAEARRAMISAFTEDLGGAPLDVDPRLNGPEIAPEVMDGLREILGVVGMELTDAGEVLIGDRMAKGATQGEALSQVVLFAFAHAVRYTASAGGKGPDFGLKEYAIEVMRELEKLRNAGEIREDRFEDDMRRLWTLVEEAPDRIRDAEQLLTDPVGGIAPPAILPAELRGVEEWVLEDL